MFQAVGSTSEVPWWWVASLAGGFTLLGALVSFAVTWSLARSRNRLEDYRRFEPDVISTYLRLDEFVDVMHNNAGGEPDEERDVYWDTYRETTRLVTRLELITSARVYRIAREFQDLMRRFHPNGSDSPMPELVDCAEELRQAIRRELRIPD